MNIFAFLVGDLSNSLHMKTIKINLMNHPTPRLHSGESRGARDVVTKFLNTPPPRLVNYGCIFLTNNIYICNVWGSASCFWVASSEFFFDPLLISSTLVLEPAIVKTKP